MITPEQLAEQLTPQPGTGQTYATQLAISDAAMDLAETILNTTRRGPHQDQALSHLLAAAHAAYAGVVPDAIPEPGPAPYDVPAHVDVDLDPALVLDVGMWRLGLMRSGAHPLTRLVGLVLSEACGASGRIPDAHQPTMRDLADRTGLHLQQVHIHLQDLTACGWITRHAIREGYDAPRFLFALRLPTR